MRRILFSTILFFILFLSTIYCEDLITAIKVDDEIIIDGKLDEAIWQKAPSATNPDFITYAPSDGQVIPQRTKIWIAYDEENIYFAFYCQDEIDRIKTSICQRDNMFYDDWIAVSIDSMANREMFYTFYANPNGIQGDSIETSTSGADVSADWVWYCGGQVVQDGYTVEMKIPLRNFRFSSGDETRMNMMFYRKIAESGMEGCWPESPPGAGSLNVSQAVSFKELETPTKIEILPSFTSSNIWERKTPDEWSDVDSVNEFGVTAKFGITSSITLEATYNPDYSQVESDEFQILVNQRYPVFYTEKRPFFMEVGNLFNLAGADSLTNIRTTVHSRNIINPQWGVKMTGEVGGLTFAVLGSGDEWPGDSDYEEYARYHGKNANFLMGRVKMKLGEENYIGALYTGRELGDYYNRVVGGDFQLRFLNNHSLKVNYLHSETFDPSTGKEKQGDSYTLCYDLKSMPLISRLSIENCDEDFQMDSAFYNRTGFSKALVLIQSQWYPELEAFSWIARGRTFFQGYYLHDKETDMYDYLARVATTLFTDKSGWFRIEYNFEGENWGGEMYDKQWWKAWSEMQVDSWIYLAIYYAGGEKISYHSADHYLGDYRNLTVYAVMQPTENLSSTLSYTYEYLDNPADDSNEYLIHLLYLNTTYQFDEHFLLRGIVQYDSYSELVLLDFLASFTYIPGTVVHLGYGSLSTKMEYNDTDGWLYGTPDSKYYQQSQSLFLKVSYRLQL
ncbi:MAG: carbohydrate binding family 9 domain-containing protein [Acidobacteria bacterium]|nr:carbohydrate binding family 9 domain-containing protein [Acidobacteriota bacterium]